MNRRLWTLTYLLLLPIAAPAAPAKDDQAEAQAILDKAIKALGGEEKLAKFTSFTAKIQEKSYLGSGETVESTKTISCLLPDRKRIEIVRSSDRFKVNLTYVLNGKEGWLSSEGKTRDLTKGQIAQLRDQAVDEMELRDQLPRFKGKGYKLLSLGGSKVGLRAVVGIEIQHEGEPDVQFYFDRVTGLPLKREWMHEVGATLAIPQPDRVKSTIVFDDYKEVGGIKFPAKKKIHCDAGTAREVEISEVKIVENFSEKTFAKPE
jgi:hypothetical protein